MNEDLAGRRVVVTGAAGGIGRAIARSLSAHGARVGIIDIRDEGAAAAAEIGGVFRRADLSDVAGTRAAMADVVERLGGIDVLVNNAGILSHASVLDLTVEEWDRTFEVNTRAMLVTTQEAATRMIAQGRGGKIINLASMAGKSGGTGQAHYAASKAAVIALTRVTALELGDRGITANALCPGYILTEMGAATRTAEDVAEWSAMSPLGRLGEPEDVASVATFLASSASDYLTGQAINVTGGMIMH